MTRARRRVLAATTAVLTALALAACGMATTPELPAGDARPPMPVGVQDPAVLPEAKPAAECTPAARQSFAPANGTAIPDGSSMAKIKANGKLVVGVDQNTYLFGYRDPATGNLTGFDVEIARQIAKAIFKSDDPKYIQFKTITSKQRIDFVKNGDVDMVVRTMTMTCDRWNDVYFSSEYLTAEQLILTKRDPADPGKKPIQKLSELGGKRVCATIGSTSINQIAAEPSKPVAVAALEWTDCLVMLQQGTVDAISTDNTILAGFQAQDPNLVLSDEPIKQEPYGIAINKERKDLVQFVNAVLEQIRADGTWAAIYADPSSPFDEKKKGPSLATIFGAAGPPAPQYGR
ncbi:ABC transporter substrate-binding protein [Actinorhabdospora filicis]|uniref:ABC transporter substrate-binding protein n=1 Tax=Actinorhabdospora filicis TaxID=1785913 RepID=A0A9W6SNB6_9ACTN|nr:glutamate ABC transporter substrate-binding protein [Actinorhabdospora filicis]GLZ79035.1 ABC transporter substrate-binding protein [Actinorhabdospora filicis]